jgi:hypothetical protein
MAEAQNFKNHAQLVPGYHGVLFLLVVGTLIGAVINVLDVPEEGLYSASLIIALTIAVLLAAFYARVFSLKAQDRAIRAEENFRHFVLTGKPLDSKLTMRQIIGLRFASDEEFPALCARAGAEGMTEKEIKQAVKNWRADHDRA